MNIQELEFVGYINKPKGLKGVMNASFEVFFLQYIEQAMVDVFFLEESGGVVPYFVEELSDKAIKFEEVDDRNAAEKIKNRKLYFEKKLLEAVIPKDEREDDGFEALIGFMVVDAADNQEIGLINDVLLLPNHELIQVLYKGNEILIPLHEELVVDIDQAAKRMLMDLPEGILEL